MRDETNPRPALWRRAVAGTLFAVAKVMRKFRRESTVVDDWSSTDGFITDSTPDPEHRFGWDVDHILRAIQAADVEPPTDSDPVEEYRALAARVDRGLGRFTVEASGPMLRVVNTFPRAVVEVTGPFGNRTYHVVIGDRESWRTGTADWSGTWVSEDQ